MHPEPEDEYFLGGGDDDYGDESDDDRRRDEDVRTRRAALLGLAVVVVLVAAAITLTAVFVDTSSSGRGPRTAAREWGTALVHGDRAARRRLECRQGSPTAAVADLILTGATGVSTGDAQRLGTDRWTVPLDIDGPDGGAQDSLSVTVVRESGRYLVC